MSSLITNATIQMRKDTAGNWTTNDPTPAAGEWCLETDTKYLKKGDGSTAWTSLLYSSEEIGSLIVSGTVDFEDAATTYYAPVSGEDSAGTLHLIPEASRPSAWVLDAGSAVTFTDVDFGAYVPTGVKAICIKYAVRVTGDGAIDSCIGYFRKNGSVVTDIDQLTVVDWAYSNLGAGLIGGSQGQIILECDTAGVVEYYVNNAAVDLYLNILGYYI